MLIRQLTLRRGVTVGAVNIKDYREIQEALAGLGIPHPKTVIVLIGGAGGIKWLEKFPMRKGVGIVAQLAEETQSVVIDGGTQAGIMTEIGKQRKRNKFSFPLIGVVFDSLLMREEPASILDSNHTHFFLIPGDDWGDESGWISKIATAITSDAKATLATGVANLQKSITVLINGGNISRTDVEYSLLENRPTFVMRGTGRMADEITLTGNVVAVDISQKPENILNFLKSKLS
jgi:TRPM family ion channel